MTVLKTSGQLDPMFSTHSHFSVNYKETHRIKLVSPNSCSLEEAGGMGAVPPKIIKATNNQHRRFCRKMKGTETGDSFPVPRFRHRNVTAKIQTVKRFKGGDFRSKA